MSCPRIQSQQANVAHVELEDIMDSFVQDVGLDVEAVKRVETHPLGHRELGYAFNAGGLSFRANIYWIDEDGLMRQYLWLEVAITKFEPASNTPLLVLALEKNQGFPVPYKLSLSDDLLILSFRSAVDGLSTDYIIELIAGMLPFSEKILEDLRSAFGKIPTVLEAVRLEEIRKGLH
jgi:hypothetical protein